MKLDSASPHLAAFEPEKYPRTYQFGRVDRWFTVVIMAALAAFGACIAAYAPLAPTFTGVAGLLLGLFFVGVALWTSAAAVRTRVVLSADRIDYRGPLSSRSVAGEDVRGWGRAANGGRGIDIQLKPGRGRKIRLYDSVSRDALFDAWLARFPNLDAAERNASLARVLDDRTLGATPADVAVRLKRAVWLARIGNVAAFVSLVEMQIAPNWWTTRVDVAVALTLSFIALLARVLFRGLVVLRPTRNDARASLFLMLVLPMFGPPVRLMTQANLQDGQTLVRYMMIAVVLGMLLAGIRRAGAGKRLLASTGVWICLGVVFVASVGWLNVWLDYRAIEPARVTVTARTFVKGPAWRIGTGPTIAAPAGRTVFVSHEDYANLQVGDAACLTDHPGLLGLRWTELHRCPVVSSR